MQEGAVRCSSGVKSLRWPPPPWPTPGWRLQRLLTEAGLHREDVFLTNALLCNPLRNGANRPPRRRELAACARWLDTQLRLVDPPLVVTLGTAALEALRIIERHPFALSRDAGRAFAWRDRT